MADDWNTPDGPADTPDAPPLEAETGPAPYVWVCETCDWRQDDWGTSLKWYAKALNHAYPKDGSPRHTVLGLYDVTTGERVCGLNSKAYRRHFRLETPGAGGAGAPDPAPAAPPAKGGGKGSGKGGAGQRPPQATSGPTRRVQVLARDIEVSDLITVAFHIVARRLPELIPPEAFATEAAYTTALGQFLEDAVIVLLDSLAREYPDRFDAQAVATALIARVVEDRLAEVEAS